MQRIAWQYEGVGNGMHGTVATEEAGRARSGIDPRARRAIAAACIGNMLEWYDFGVYAFPAGANLYAACLGYKLVSKRNADGNPVLDREGLPVMTREIDEAGAEWGRAAYELFVVRGWNCSKIALQFNARAAGGVRIWDATKVKQLLEREVYRGGGFYRKTRQRKDPVDSDQC